MDAPLPLRTEFLFRMSLTVGAPQAIGPSRGTELRVVPVTGGTVAGPRLKAEVLPGPAGDWLRIEPDGTTHLDVRLTFRASGGALVYCQYTGLRAGPIPSIAFVLLPLGVTLGLWGIALSLDRLPAGESDIGRVTALALVVAGPGTSIAALMARTWWPRLVGVVVTSGLAATVFIGRALFGA